MIKALKPLLASPHRSFFLLGITGFIFIMVWWVSGRGASTHTLFPSGWSHTWLMVFGVFLPFICGFLFTAYPRWLGAKGAPRILWLITGLFQGTGTILFISAAGSSEQKMLLGVMAWLLSLALILGHLVHARFQGKGAWLHSMSMLIVFTTGISALILLLCSLVLNAPILAMISATISFWVFLLGVFLVVAHRMIPFFAGCVLDSYEPYRPASLLLLLLLLAGTLATLKIGGHTQWQWLALLPMTLICGFLAWRWQFWRALRPRLLLSLFLAWGSLVFGLGIGAVQSFTVWSGGQIWAGRAPEHLIAIGFFGAMVIAMATRVTLGHSGRPLQMGGLAWFSFLTVLLAAWVRVLAEISPYRETLILLTGCLWIGAGLLWAFRFAPMLALPRADHKPE